MAAEESRYPLDWLRVAEKDLARVEHLLALEDAEAAGFYLQQTVEKHLKAFLLARGWRLQRIHDLEALLNAALEHDATIEPFRSACQVIAGFYLVHRYPFLGDTGLTSDDVQRTLEEVKPLLAQFSDAIRQSP